VRPLPGKPYLYATWRNKERMIDDSKETLQIGGHMMNFVPVMYDIVFVCAQCVVQRGPRTTHCRENTEVPAPSSDDMSIRPALPPSSMNAIPQNDVFKSNNEVRLLTHENTGFLIKRRGTPPFAD
jgi:hypothetical protein